MADVLTLENKKILKLGGVKEVGGFCEREIKLELANGDCLTVKGDGLKINSFSKDNGNFELVGNVCEIKFKLKRNLFGKVFK